MMKRQTRKLMLNLATGAAVAMTAAVVLIPAANAAPATATTAVNVRSGPGANFRVVDTLRTGQQVDVQRCQGNWCYIEKDGPDGWVSATYLRGGTGPTNQDPSIRFGLTFGPGGPNISIGVGPQPQPPQPTPPAPEPFIGEACFYSNTQYRGQSFCVEEGESISSLGSWSGRINSIENPDGLAVQVCQNENFRSCRTYTTNASSLGSFPVRSIRVR